MGKRYSELSDEHRQFMQTQKIFFVGTAPASGKVDIPPKRMDSLRLVDGRRVVWLNLTGSGNETSAHVRESPRMTLMFMSFEGSPLILRLYGDAKVIHRNDREWGDPFLLFHPLPEARQTFDFEINLVQESCGLGVPNYNYAGEGEELPSWATRKEEESIKDYWKRRNQISLDRKPTNIIGKITS